ncbi:hypothetical protein HELRODRAFT_190500 [Helobdella robusta]|uniref:C-type lectin domain-containing protein n=1 Tax=Helobdella robusta TaxID=6412 RepID=T1FS17_HELRO|nr:hypothetical protein HELRODRAFT_190500 [Helobdella robusta]ESO09449.1 hypothetical protein HELRODRAFT_190500 [Helobdella robusta]
MVLIEGRIPHQIIKEENVGNLAKEAIEETLTYTSNLTNLSYIFTTFPHGFQNHCKTDNVTSSGSAFCTERNSILLEIWNEKMLEDCANFFPNFALCFNRSILSRVLINAVLEPENNKWYWKSNGVSVNFSLFAPNIEIVGTSNLTAFLKKDGNTFIFQAKSSTTPWPVICMRNKTDDVATRAPPLTPLPASSTTPSLLTTELLPKPSISISTTTAFNRNNNNTDNNNSSKTSSVVGALLGVALFVILVLTIGIAIKCYIKKQSMLQEQGAYADFKFVNVSLETQSQQQQPQQPQQQQSELEKQRQRRLSNCYDAIYDVLDPQQPEEVSVKPDIIIDHVYENSEGRDTYKKAKDVEKERVVEEERDAEKEGSIERVENIGKEFIDVLNSARVKIFRNLFRKSLRRLSTL